MKIAAVIAAYNESRHVQRVLDVLAQSHILDEIVVVDDGSRDNTGTVVLTHASSDPRVRLIRHPKNLGKGQAIFTGVESTDAGIVLMLDADLIALQPCQVNDLILPVSQGLADMTLGLFRGGLFVSDFAHWATPWLSGQRCLLKDLFGHLSRPAAAGYGLETAITVTAAIENWKVRRIRLKGVYHPSSEFHRGLLPGISVRARMYGQIVRAWYLAGGVERLKSWYLPEPVRSSKVRREKEYRRL